VLKHRTNDVLTLLVKLFVGTYISYVISVYDAGTSAYKFTILALNLVRVLGFSLGTTLVA
jgi:hypothetical protein